VSVATVRAGSARRARHDGAMVDRVITTEIVSDPTSIGTTGAHNSPEPSDRGGRGGGTAGRCSFEEVVPRDGPRAGEQVADAW